MNRSCEQRREYRLPRRYCTARTLHLSCGPNKPQRSWYEKHGDRDKFAGICYVAKVSDAPADAPLYAVVWGEPLASRPYTCTYQTPEQVSGNVSGTVRDENGNTSTVEGTTTTSVPVQHTESGVSRAARFLPLNQDIGLLGGNGSWGVLTMRSFSKAFALPARNRSERMGLGFA
jgi:hypothetical protein